MVTGTEGFDLRLRAGPGLSFVTLRIVKEGSRLVVLDGPETVDELTWWRVRDEDDVVGWVVEDYLIPLSSAPTQLTPGPQGTP
jgi:SH3-like domain-containing protein